MTFDELAELRKFVVAHFSYDALKLFCNDYYRDVYEQWTDSGISKDMFALRLVQYCDKHDILNSLYADLQQVRPAPFAENFPAYKYIPKPQGLQLQGKSCKIIYAVEDSDIAQIVLAEMIRLGMKASILPNHKLPKEKWDDAQERLTDSSDKVLVVLTPNAQSSKRVKQEVSEVLEQDKQIELFQPPNVERVDPSVISPKLADKQTISYEKLLRTQLTNETNRSNLSQSDSRIYSTELPPINTTRPSLPANRQTLGAVIVGISLIIVFLALVWNRIVLPSEITSTSTVAAAAAVPTRISTQTIQPETSTAIVTPSATPTITPSATSISTLTPSPTISPTETIEPFCQSTVSVYLRKQPWNSFDRSSPTVPINTRLVIIGRHKNADNNNVSPEWLLVGSEAGQQGWVGIASCPPQTSLESVKFYGLNEVPPPVPTATPMPATPTEIPTNTPLPPALTSIPKPMPVPLSELNLVVRNGTIQILDQHVLVASLANSWPNNFPYAELTAFGDVEVLVRVYSPFAGSANSGARVVGLGLLSYETDALLILSKAQTTGGQLIGASRRTWSNVVSDSDSDELGKTEVCNGDSVYLRVTKNDQRISFFCSRNGSDWVTVGRYERYFGTDFRVILFVYGVANDNGVTGDFSMFEILKR